MPAMPFDVSDVCHKHGSGIIRRCRVLLRNDDEARDAAQEVFVTLLEKGHQYRGDSALMSWIYRITTNVCLNRLRSGQRRHRREQADGVVAWMDRSPTNPYEQYAACDLIQTIVSQFDELSGQIFIYVYLDGMTQQECAQQVGRSRKTVNKRLQAIETQLMKREGVL